MAAVPLMLQELRVGTWGAEAWLAGVEGLWGKKGLFFEVFGELL